MTVLICAGILILFAIWHWWKPAHSVIQSVEKIILSHTSQGSEITAVKIVLSTPFPDPRWIAPVALATGLLMGAGGVGVMVSAPVQAALAPTATPTLLSSPTSTAAFTRTPIVLPTTTFTPEPSATAMPTTTFTPEPSATSTQTTTPVPPTATLRPVPTVTPVQLTMTPTPVPVVSTSNATVCLTAEEAKLIRLINNYRDEHGLPEIPASVSLVQVAHAHVRDLQDNHPDTGTDSRGEKCNMHSWSNQGGWSPVCYTADHKYASGMWNKPREITGNIYTAAGYENAYSGGGSATADGAFEGWKNDVYHDDVILEKGIWAGKNWPAMGVGIYVGYAALWFGDQYDPQGIAVPCS
jgi:uncharacterized protein YkwD